MRNPTSAFILGLLAVAHDWKPVYALRWTARGERRSARSVHKRAGIVGASSVASVADLSYTTDIKLGGKTFNVQIDTGSSDLWVTGDVPNSSNTQKQAQVVYAIDSIEGPILTATLEFSGYTIKDQAFINVAASKKNPEGTGLIGLGPNTGSQIQDAFGTADGDSVLDRIFRQNTTTPNYVTFLLGRATAPGDSLPGEFTVGELVPGYESVNSQPKLPVSVLSKADEDNQHWQVLLDADGIVGPAGNNVIDQYNVKTGVSATSNKKQLTVVIDTGYSLPQVPTAVAKAFYSDIPGAQLVNVKSVGPLWQFDCDKEVNITFKFGGVNIPIHPLDASVDLNLTDSSGKDVCFGAFQPSSLSAQEDALYDMIFGMSFLRNVYTYINFGDFVDGSTKTTADPYIQFLSVTNDSALAHADFVKVRGASSWHPQDASLGEQLKSRLPLVIGVSVAVGVLVLLALVGCVYSRRKRGRALPFFQPVTRYQPLHEPAPDAYDMQHRPTPATYSNPWDARY